MANEGMKKLENLYISKINKYVKEINERYIQMKHTPITDVSISEIMEHISPSKARTLSYKPVKDGYKWGKPWSTAWFRLRFKIPKDFTGEAVSLVFKTEGECIIFNKNIPVQALDTGRDEYTLLNKAHGGEYFELYIEAGANEAFGWFNKRTMHQPKIAILVKDVWNAYWDMKALADMIDVMPRSSTRRAKIIFNLNKAINIFDYNNPSIADLKAQAKKARKVLKPVYDCKADASAQTIGCFGHAHIDVAWLWPLAETVRKCGRTFSNVINIMEEYPEFKFSQSQPQLYEYTKQRYPSLYKRIKEKIKNGQWIPTGCMWVEADCNVTSGESLVRQCMFGIRFFKEEFNYDIATLWLPDVFGYSTAIPQIIKRCGIDYFLTQKISWNQFSKFPYNSFWWEGLDGTKVLAHFPPINTYNAILDAKEIISASDNYREKDRSDIQAAPYGYGDGGGGPTKDMLERINRYSNLEGVPKLKTMTPRVFFEKLNKNSTKLPRWVGELYFELHRGTYTTQAYNKKFNRRAEFLLRETEMLSVLNMTTGGQYNQKHINEAWKLVLLNQFHDIIPGSSIDLVYKDSDRDYKEIFQKTGNVKKKALSYLTGKVDTRGKGIPVFAFNPLSWKRKDIVSLTASKLDKKQSYVAVAPDGKKSPVQISPDGRARFIADVPSIGHSVFHINQEATTSINTKTSTRIMENNMIRISFNKQGCIKRIYDKKAKRDVLESGRIGNQFILFEDKTSGFGEAWDIDIFYNEKPLEVNGKLISSDIIEDGAVRSVVRFKRKISKSIITQDIILTNNSNRIDFKTTIDWKDEKDVLLKVAFPVNVRSDKATYEIQFGAVERPTHWNTPQDFGKFEVPAQKWADLSENGYGVALLNDCKYGYDTHDNIMRLTLLRAPKYPGKTADINKIHKFTYSILPHTGNYTNGVVRSGYELNVPITAEIVKPSPGKTEPCESALSISEDNVIIDTIKKAEDDNGIIVRMYEAYGSRNRTTFQTKLPIKKMWETNLMEKIEKQITIKNGKAKLNFKPFQIRTFKLII